jgi:hypothetical protein
MAAKTCGAIGVWVTEQGSREIQCQSLAIVIVLTVGYFELLQQTEPASRRIFAAIHAPHAAPDFWWKERGDLLSRIHHG